MPSNKPSLQAVVSEKTYKKVKYLAINDERSLSQYTARIVERYIEEYEKQHGAIPIDTPKGGVKTKCSTGRLASRSGCKKRTKQRFYNPDLATNVYKNSSCAEFSRRIQVTSNVI